jgi:hypothetical protein
VEPVGRDTGRFDNLEPPISKQVSDELSMEGIVLDDKNHEIRHFCSTFIEANALSQILFTRWVDLSSLKILGASKADRRQRV